MNNIKRIMSFCLMFIVCLSIISLSSIQEAEAAISVSKVTNSTNINSKYSFASRYIPGVTKLETFGGSSYASDVWNTENVTISQGTKSIRLTSANQKGKIGAWYRNVGEYEGEMLDLKITVMDWKELRKPVGITVNGKVKKSYPCIFFTGKTIAVSTTDKMIKKPKFRFEYYNQEGRRVQVTGHQTFKDIDVAQYIESANFVRCYLTNDTKLNVSGNKIYSGKTTDMQPTDKKYWTTGLFEGLNYYDVVFSVDTTDNMDFNNTKLSYRGIDTFSITGDSLAPFTTPTPKKSGTRYVHKGNVVKYNINFTVPQQPVEYRYETFKVKDVLPKGIKYKSFKVTNDAGDDVSNLFNATINGQTFNASVINPKNSSFYYKSYNLELICEADNNFDFSSLNNGGKVEVRNKASIISKAGTRAEGTKVSNEVLTEVRFKILTSTDGNGTITSSMDNVVGGSDKTISYTPKAGYKIDTVTVDNKKVEATSYKSSYLFKDVYDNHKIHVTFKPTTDNRITVTKKVHKNDFKDAYGNPVGIFKCEGKDLNGNSHEYYEAVELTKNDLNGDYYTKTVTFDNLIAGTYKVEEVDTSRYDLTKVAAGSGSTSNNNILNCDLVNNKIAEGTFTNSLAKFNLWSHSNIVINNFK